MGKAAKTVAVTVGLLVALAVIVAVVYLKTTGLSARPAPGAVEAGIARSVRRLAVPADVRDRANPVPPSAEVIADGRVHFADHCASCHANDGSGNTEMGQGLFPKPPDMATVSQELTDGELFYFIEEGIRFTGMPAWGTGSPAGETASWHLVHFIRHLPAIGNDEIEAMEGMNPRPPAEIRQEMEADRFLRGDDAPPAAPAAPSHEHGGTQ
jgi:mono/diheme cytochrome c family protein